MAHTEPIERSLSRKRLDRMRTVLGAVQGRGDVAVDELAAGLGVSPAALRRDLTHLADQGLVVRTHGAVRASGLHAEIPVRLRDSEGSPVKRRIAQYATRLLPTGPHALAVSGGTTTNEVVRALRTRNDTTILTNAMSIAVEAATAPRLKIIVTGGTLRANSLEAVGPLAEAAFNTFNVQTAFLGADGVTASSGVTTHDEAEARTNHIMVTHAQRVIVVCDGSKVGRITMAQMATLDIIQDVVTDSTADPAELQRITELGVKVHVVDPSESPTGDTTGG